ncbi:MAG TPA: FGGY family carbohydrate kinase [Geminicoccaceae bacterium]|nr:FGGY family carbohydrate kinase [Geminicoccaceae bacterium]
MPERQPVVVAIDVGTGSVRAALVAADGRILAFAARPHDQHTPRPDWSEQSPAAWWGGVCACLQELRATLPDARIEAVAACGQMHAPVPIGAEGELLAERVQLWNDKRAAGLVASFAGRPEAEHVARLAANPPAPAWIAFKLAWLREHAPDLYRRAAVFLTPKDFVNWRLTGVAATDRSEASGSFVLAWRTLAYDPEPAAALGIDLAKLPPPLPSTHVIGRVTREAARLTGLPAGVPVVAGGGDFLVALLGSGVSEPGVGSDITGTSTLISVHAEAPILDPRVMNLHAAGEGWVPFAMIDAGGDAIRWARRLLHEPATGFEQITALAAASAAGAEGLLFLPYLNGERLGPHGNARAQFFGVTARHGKAHFHRAVMEGCAIASDRNLRAMRAAGARFERIVATGGGAKARLWLEIKANVYGLPVIVPEERESGLLGCAALAGTAVGLYPDLAAAVRRLVRHEPPILPDAALVERYARLKEIFADLYAAAGPFYDRLDRAVPIDPAGLPPGQA